VRPRLAAQAAARPWRWPSVAAAAVLALGSLGAFADDAPQAAPHAAAVKKAVPAMRPLDLSAPPIDHVLTREQVQALTSDQDDDANPPVDDVMVERAHVQQPVPGGIVAIPWALLHPLQAWRIFAPLTDD
jgi:hypothetical protein